MTPYKRGLVVLINYPNSDLISFKKRPALVVQANTLRTGLGQTIVAMITSNLERTGPTRIRIASASITGQAMGLMCDSVIVVDNIATVLDREIDKSIGTLRDMSTIDTALRLIFDL